MMNLEKMWKEPVAASFQVQCGYLLGRTEVNQEKAQSGQRVSFHTCKLRNWKNVERSKNAVDWSIFNTTTSTVSDDC